jgi:hypothetical protein
MVTPFGLGRLSFDFGLEKNYSGLLARRRPEFECLGELEDGFETALGYATGAQVELSDEQTLEIKNLVRLSL